jgi:hypothetical protein
MRRNAQQNRVPDADRCPVAGLCPIRDGERCLRRRPRLSESRPVVRRGLSRVDAALYIGISPTKFDELRKHGQIAPPRVIDGRKVWDVYALDEAFEAFPVEGSDIEEDWNTAL